MQKSEADSTKCKFKSDGYLGVLLPRSSFWSTYCDYKMSGFKFLSLSALFIETPVISEILQIPYSQGCTKCGSLVAGLAAKQKSCRQFLAGSRSSKPIHKTEADSFLRHLTSHSKRLRQPFSG